MRGICYFLSYCRQLVTLLASRCYLPTPKKSYNTWSIYLLKEGISIHEALNPKYASSLTEHDVALSEQRTAKLFVKVSPSATPKWAKTLGPLISPAITAKAKTLSAAMFIETEHRNFALTFGFGKTLLSTEAWEQEFGLKVVLNIVDEESVREIELSGFDSLLQNKQAQSVRDANIDEFDIDVDQDVVRSIKGTPKNLELGRTVSGRDSLHISTSIEPNKLPELLSTLLEESDKETYLDKFSWVGRMKEVRLPDLKNELNESLIARLHNKIIEKSWIAPPEYTQWKDGCAFVYPLDRKNRHDDIRLPFFLQLLEKRDKLSALDINDLKRWKIEVVDENGQERDGWTVYRCLYVEVELNGSTYILNNGGWYLIDSDYFAEINNSFVSFPQYAGELPPYHDANEGAYNKRICEENSQFCLMDKKTVELKKRGLTKIEFCDVYEMGGKIIHIKRYSGSSELSHLFAQGVVSAELFLHEPDFRTLVNAKLSDTHQIADPTVKPNAQDYEVVYGIVSKSQNPISLPFFSKIMLRNARQRLEDLGFAVSLSKIISESENEGEADEEV